MEYWLVTTGEGSEGINGGLMASQDGQPRTVNTIAVDSVDDYCAKVTAAGGQVVVEKMPIAGVGWIAYCTDPGGAIFGIYKHDEAAGR
jgi:predicted enzyme related to lactoylglutathione lyase